ncbi:MAG: nucleotide exchange factor GrpE [Clostridiales bacterium]|nr:nucleotide exchange factor GrpE [Clostridiales bacterium]
MTEENKNLSEETGEEVNTEAADSKETTAGSEGEGVETPETEETAEETAEASEQAESETKERKFFGKKKEKKDKKDEKIEELTDQVKRQMAEFDNYRKRTEKEKASMYVIGAKEIVEKILPVVDNFERGLGMAAGSEDPFVQGMEKIYKQLMTTLDEMGVKPIEAVGNEFNPDFHNAVMHVEDEEAGENIVVEEFQKGYLYKDFVVRHSMVKVAN